MVTPFAEGRILKAATCAEPIHIETLTNDGPVLVLTPHPDDESLGCGAAIAAATDRGLDVIVVCLTDGGGSHPGSIQYPPNRIAALRLCELETAVKTLSSGRSKVLSFALPDQGITPERLQEYNIHEKLSSLVREGRFTTIWTTWRDDPHIDHQAAADLAQKVKEGYGNVQVWEFPIWGRFRDTATVSSDSLRIFDSRPFAARKWAAIQSHRSQMTNLIDDDLSGFTMEPQVQRHFLDWPELFIQASPA